MGTSLGPKYIPYTYMDPLGEALVRQRNADVQLVNGYLGRQDVPE